MRKEHTTSVVAKIYTDGFIEEVNCKMTLKEMQDFVGGYIEMVPSKVPLKATEYVAAGVWVLDFVRGNALLVKWM